MDSSLSHSFVLSSHWAFGARLSIIRLCLLSLVHTQGSPDSFAFLALLGVHISALLLSFISSFPLSPSIWLARHFVLYIRHFSCFVPFRVALFRVVFSLVSSRIFSRVIAVFLNPLCSLSSFLLCYGTSSSPLSVSVSLLSLCFLCLFYLRSTTLSRGQRFKHQCHYSPHDTMYVIVSEFGIHIDRKRILHKFAADVEILFLRFRSKWMVGF